MISKINREIEKLLNYSWYEIDEALGIAKAIELLTRTKEHYEAYGDKEENEECECCIGEKGHHDPRGPEPETTGSDYKIDVKVNLDWSEVQKLIGE